MCLGAAQLLGQTAVQYTNGDVFYTRDLQLKPDKIYFKPIGEEPGEYVIVPLTEIANIKFTDGSLMEFNEVVIPATIISNKAELEHSNDSLFRIVEMSLKEVSVQLQSTVQTQNDSLMKVLMMQSRAQKDYYDATLLLMQAQINQLIAQSFILDSILNTSSSAAELPEIQNGEINWQMPKSSLGIYMFRKPNYDMSNNKPTSIETQVVPNLGCVLSANFNNAARRFRFQIEVGYQVDMSNNGSSSKQAISEVLLGMAFLGQKQYGQTNIYSGLRLEYAGSFHGDETQYMGSGFVTGVEYAPARHLTIGAEATQFVLFNLENSPGNQNTLYGVQPRLHVNWYFE